MENVLCTFDYPTRRMDANSFMPNKASKNHVCQDITQTKGSVIGHDLLIGGFPCQYYLVAKKGPASNEESKGLLWWQIDNIIREKHPTYILPENLDRLTCSLAKHRGYDFSIALRYLYEKGYAVERRVINTADYGKVQRCCRTFILAYHNNTETFSFLAEEVCIHGLKVYHQHVIAGKFPRSLFCGFPQPLLCQKLD